MLDLIKDRFEKGYYLIGLEHTVENDSIGVYEFWGATFRDDQDDYIVGSSHISFLFDEYITEEEKKEFEDNYLDFLEEYQDRIEEVIYDRMEAFNITDSEILDYEVRGKTVKFFIDFVAK